MQKSVCTTPKKWQHLRHNSSTRTLVLPGARVRKHVVDRKSQQTHGQWDLIALQMVGIPMCHTSHPTFFSDRTTSPGQVRKGGRHCHFQGTFENKKILINIILAGNILCIYNCICHWCDTENLVLTPRRSEEEEQLDLDPELLTTITQKKEEHLTSSMRLAKR